jgi:hypothetical protein
MYLNFVLSILFILYLKFVAALLNLSMAFVHNSVLSVNVKDMYKNNEKKQKHDMTLLRII